jgi:hypothetical protein
MVQIPVDEIKQEDIQQWYVLQDQLKKLKASEMLLRTRIFKGLFPNPVEGTNNYPLPEQWVLKGGYKLTRNIDIGSLQAMRERFAAAGVRADSLVEYKPSLVLSEYRTLTDEQRQLFDQCLEIKPGSPSLEIVLPAKAKKETSK